MRRKTGTRDTGRLIAIEGGEGAGKTTLAAALCERLRAAGRDAVLTHEPGGSALGDVVSQAVRRVDLDPLAELLLFAAARAQSLRDVVRPALARSAIVVTDRYVASTVAYQGYGRGLPLSGVEAANRIATGGLAPHLTVLLDLPPEVGLRRDTTDPAGDRLRGEDLAFHTRVRQGYLSLAAANAERWLVVDATLDAAAVLETAWRRVEALVASR